MCNLSKLENKTKKKLGNNSHILKVPYYDKHIFSGLYIYKLVLHEPANSQNEESKQVLHHLCSPPTGKTDLLQAVQIQLLLLRNDRRDVHRPAIHPQVKFSVSSGKIAVFCNVVAQG